MFMDGEGCGVRIEGAVDVTEDVIDRTVDLLILKFDRAGLSLSQMGKPSEHTVPKLGWSSSTM